MSKASKTPPTHEPDPFTLLWFVRDIPKGEPPLPNGSRRHFWTVPSTGDFAFDCELGVALGRRTVSVMRWQDAAPNLLALVISDMIAAGLNPKGRLTGVQIGFLSEIQRAIAARGGLA